MTGKPIPIRIDDDLIARFDKLAEVMSARAAGAKLPRTSVIRLAMERGAALLEQELGLGAARSPTPVRRRRSTST